MLPTLQPDQLIIFVRTKKNLKSGDIIIFKHDGLEKVKRVTEVARDTLSVAGDNPAESTDSRHFGDIPSSSVLGKLIWPLPHKTKTTPRP